LPVFQEKINRGGTAELTAKTVASFFSGKIGSADSGEGLTHFFLNRDPAYTKSGPATHIIVNVYNSKNSPFN